MVATPITWFSGSMAPMPVDDPFDAKLDRLERAFILANTTPITLDPEPEFSDKEMETGEDILSDVLAEAIARTVEQIDSQPKPVTTATELVSLHMSALNPWQVLEDQWTRIVTLPRASDALVMLLEDAMHVPQAEDELKRMIQRILVSARNALEAYREIEKSYADEVDEARRTVSAARAELKPVKTAQPVQPVWDDFGFDDGGDYTLAAPSKLQLAQSKLKTLLASRPKHETGTRPADLYRTYAKALRFLRKQGYLKAGTILRDLMMESTLPVADLDNPDHIDSYTGEIDPEAAEYRLRIPSTPSNLPMSEAQRIPVGEEQKKLMETMKWDEKTLQQFVNAQDGYTEEPGDEIAEWVNEFGQEARDPMWMQIQHDFASSDRYIDLVQEARPYTDRCREVVENTMRLVKSWLKVYLYPGDGQKRNEQIVEIIMKLGTWEEEGELRKYLNKLANRDWPLEKKLSVFATNTVKTYFPVSLEAIEFIEFLKELVRRGESEVDIALIFLSLQNGLMFPEEASMAVPLEITSQSGTMTLYDFIEENEEEILANLNDRAPKRTEEPYDLVALVAEQGLKQAIGTGEPKSTEVKKTPEYIEGYLRAAMTVKQATYRDEGGYHNTLEESGWSNFRIKRSPKGAELYSDVRMRGGTQAQAMSAFWKQLNLEKRRKEEARIKSVLSDGKGLTLANGRQVSWNIAIMKFNGGEFEHTKEEWTKILNFLRSKKVGSYFCQVVEKSLIER